MRLIKPSFLIKEQEPGLVGIYKQIEWAGRHCYKSHDKITEGSAERFVNAMIKSGHHSVLEHGTVYLLYSESCYSYPTYKQCSDFVQKYYDNPYSKVTYLGLDDDNLGTSNNPKYRGDILGVGVYGNLIYAISTNFRVLIENNWLNDLRYLCEPTEHHERRVTVRFTTSNGIMREFTRHRSHSFAVESTRYCNYSKDKFNNELTFIIPSWSKLGECQYTVDKLMPLDQLNRVEKEAETNWLQSLASSEVNYLHMIEVGYKPQEAREVLPLATKCDMVMTGFTSDWDHFFDLRARGTTGAPHPDAKALAEPLMQEFIKRNYIKE